jgi:hypothetical protein
MTSFFLLPVSFALAESSKWEHENTDAPGFAERFFCRSCTCSINKYRDGSGVFVSIRSPEFFEPFFFDILEKKDGSISSKASGLLEVEIYAKAFNQCYQATKELPDERIKKLFKKFMGVGQ